MKGHLSNVFWGMPLVLFITQIRDVICHGGMLEPPMRSIAWRYGFDTPVNYDWMSLYCGGLHTFKQNGGKCGLCGDPYQGPYENDRGGSYDTGVIVRHYPIGLPEVDVKVELTAHHKGYFRFKLCPNNDNALTAECLDRYPLRIREGQTQGDPYRYYPAENPKLYELHVILPPEVTCDRCVLQWTYTAGNNAGSGPDGRSCLGCGIQETFVNCADISIGGTRDVIPVAKGNGNATRAGPEVILSERPDIVNIIRNAPPERSLEDFMREIRQPQRRPEVPKRHFEQPSRAAEAPFDQWAFDENTGFGGREVPPPDFVDQIRNDWGPGRGGGSVLTDSTLTQASGRGTNIFSGQNQGGASRGERMAFGHPLDFSGISNPLLRTALSNHFQRRNPSGHGANSLSPRPPVPRDSFRDPLAAPLSARSRVDTMDLHIQNGGRSDNHVISGEGHASSLLGSLDPLLNEIHHRQRGTRHHSGMLQPSGVLSDQHLMRNLPPMGTDIFGNPTDQLFPASPNRHHHHQTAQSPSFLRNAMHTGSGTSQIHNLHSMHAGSMRFTSGGRLVPFSRSQFRTQEKVVGVKGGPVPSNMRSHHTLPGRIVVHSMDVAQALLRRYPQLKGRVFLSSHAHQMNKYANTANRYRQRQHW